VFLLELISGCEAHKQTMLHPDENIVFQVYLYMLNASKSYSWIFQLKLTYPLINLKARNSADLDKFVDITLGHQEKHGARQILMLALLCVDVTSRRPSMAQIVLELERIQREIAPMYSQFSDEIGAVTLGSELFQ